MLNTTMTIQNISNASEYLSSIDMVDVDFEFYKAVSGDDENIYAICYKDKIIGLSNIICDEWGFLYVYIFPEHRGLVKLYERLGFQEISCNEYAKKRIQ